LRFICVLVVVVLTERQVESAQRQEGVYKRIEARLQKVETWREQYSTSNGSCMQMQADVNHGHRRLGSTQKELRAVMDERDKLRAKLKATERELRRPKPTAGTVLLTCLFLDRSQPQRGQRVRVRHEIPKRSSLPKRA
jgi:hypothetical protein